MSDPLIVIGRILMLLFHLLMLVLPLALALLVPRHHADEATRMRHRGMLTTLSIATIVALATWAGLALTGTRFPWASWVAFGSWVLFFPLWFGLAWPLIRVRNPAWSGTLHATEDARGALRTASLVNRARLSPVTRCMWVLAALASAACPVAIAARGLMPFPLETGGAIDDTMAAAQRIQWMVFLGVSCMAPLGLLWLPVVLRSMLREPEPMDAAGSAELAALYAHQRRRRILGMFWLNGVAAPLVIGGVFALATWFPQVGGFWGIVGGVGGSILGIIGAIYGFMMTAERARIAEARARLERGQPGLGA